MANFLENLWGTEGAVDILLGGPDYRHEQQMRDISVRSKLAALKDRKKLMRMVQDIKQLPPGPERDARIQECQLIMGFRVQPYQQQDWLTTAGKLGKEMDTLRDEYGIVRPEEKDVFDFLNEKRMSQYGKGGYGKPSEGVPTPETIESNVFEKLRQPRQTPSVEPTAQDLEIYRRMGPEEYTSPSGKKYKTKPGEKGLGAKLQPSPFAGISTPEMRGDILSGGVQGWPTVSPEVSEDYEFDVFKQLMPKKTVKQLQKQKSREPNALELSQIFATAKVSRMEITKEVAKLKSIWSELNLQEKLDIYTLLAQGRTATEIIEFFKKQTEENG